MTQGKTLKELDVKPGDVVVMCGDETCERLTILECPPRTGHFHDHWDVADSGTGALVRDELFELVSRATPVMTLPNGDVLREGDWAKLRNGDVVGPLRLKLGHNNGFYWDSPKWGAVGFNMDGTRMYSGKCPDIIAKAPAPCTSQAEEGPTLWRDMTPEQKGALLLAHHEGKAIECSIPGDRFWEETTPSWIMGMAYRIKREPKREMVEIVGGLYYDCGHIFEKGNNNKSWYTHRITFDTIDGKPDPESIKMEVTE